MDKDKKTLIIGSTVLDIIINVDRLPTTAGDLHINQQNMVIGGCAYNVQNIIALFQVPFLFCSPVGTGIYGDYIAEKLLANNIEPFVRIKNQDNGCCYCYVEPSGERTFLSYHGAEYVFKEVWMNELNMENYDSVYVCGLEIEEETGQELLSFLGKNKELEIFFAPGPRFSMIDQGKISHLLKLSPVLHLNKEEILTFTKKPSIDEAASHMFATTSNTIVVTDGENGSYYYDSTGLHHVAGIKTKVVDTIGAGDSHIGTIIACLKKGFTYKHSLKVANEVAAKVVATKGSILTTL